jgi:hypothetical protein
MAVTFDTCVGGEFLTKYNWNNLLSSEILYVCPNELAVIYEYSFVVIKHEDEYREAGT